jgi:hypothetical protein
VELSTIGKYEKGTEKRGQATFSMKKLPVPFFKAFVQIQRKDKKRGEQKCSPPLKDVKFFLSFA